MWKEPHTDLRVLQISNNNNIHVLPYFFVSSLDLRNRGLSELFFLLHSTVPSLSIQGSYFVLFILPSPHSIPISLSLPQMFPTLMHLVCVPMQRSNYILSMNLLKTCHICVLHLIKGIDIMFISILFTFLFNIILKTNQSKLLYAPFSSLLLTAAYLSFM